MTVSFPDPHVKDFAGIQRNFDALRKVEASVVGESINVDSAPYNGSFAAAVAALPESQTGRKTGKIVVPAGTVRNVSTTINANDCSGLVIEGIGGQSDNAGRPLIIWTGASGSLLTAASGSGLQLRNLVLTYNNPAYNGDLVKFGHSARAVDPFYAKVEDCYLAGIQGASGARSLLNLDRAIGAKVYGTQFIDAQRGILGVDTAYCNGTTISGQCIFDRLSVASIVKPGEAWSITENIFGPAADGTPRAIDSQDFVAIALAIERNWFGDCTTTGTTANAWISVRGRGVKVATNRLSIELAGVAHRCIVFRNVLGGKIETNNFSANGGLALNNDPKGIDFQAVSGQTCDKVVVECNRFTNIRLDFDETGLTSGEYHMNTGLTDKTI